MIGAPFFERHFLDLGDLARVVLAEGTAENGEVLGEDEHGAAADRAPAGHHAVAGDLSLLHAEIGAAVLDEHVELLERAVVEQQFDALARGELPLACWAAMRCSPPPRRARARRRSRPGEHLFRAALRFTARRRVVEGRAPNLSAASWPSPDSSPIGAKTMSLICRHARPCAGHQRAGEAEANLDGCCSGGNVDDRDKPGHDGKGYSNEAAFILAPIEIKSRVTAMTAVS